MNYDDARIEMFDAEDMSGGFFSEEEELDLIYNDGDSWNGTMDSLIDKYVSLEEGFDITRNNWGYLNLEYWAEITGLTVEQIIYRANGKLMWRDPRQIELGADETVGWLTREQILQGNRIRKIKEAKELNKRYGQMDEVIKLLADNLPEEVAGSDIHVNIGSTWVLEIENFVADFIAELLDVPFPPKVSYDSYRGRWTVEYIAEPNYVLNNYTYGTPQFPCTRILECKLNAKPIKAYDQEYNFEKGYYESVLNRSATLAAQEKAKSVDVRFQDYCHGDKENEERIQNAYASQYGYGLCRFDGDYLALSDAAEKITLYKHQKDAVAHIMACHNVLLAHNVGSGKTYEYSCGLHELIRLGICKKAVVVVPNNTLSAVSKAYQDLFPMDETLVCRPRIEFAPAKRKETLERIKATEKLIVFMAYSSFDMLTMSKKYAFAKKDAELRECAHQIASASSYAQKIRLQALEKRMQKSVKQYKETFKDGETACFDSLAFDAIVVDECHNFKNITLNYNADNIVGLHCKGSKKADNMVEKVRFIQENNGRVIFASGTPITNSMADLYVLQYYLQPEELKLCNVYHFNDWINTFAEEEHDFEIDVDSKNGRFTTRFSRFHNLPELMAMFSEVCDFYQGSNEELHLPEFAGYTDVVVKKSKEQKKYIDKLAVRTEAIRNHEVKRTEDNLLKITVNGRQAALDIRLVKPDTIYVTKENKAFVCAETMAKLYFSYPDKCQIAFSDISTPKAGFNIYDELKRLLIQMGVQSDHIAFVHDAVTEGQRSRLEKCFNQGEIRILMGSTQKLGTGSNVQEKLVAIHNVDVPWRPADMAQREGRIIRQGNTCEEVFIYRYITEASFDAYTYQILENKQKFIAQFLSGSLAAVHREESDCADTVLSYAEIKALAIGNPLVKERVEVANQLEHARMNQRQKRKELVSLQELKEQLPAMVQRRKHIFYLVRSDMEFYEKKKEPIKREERQSFGEELLFALNENVMEKEERLFHEYQGFDVFLPKHMDKEKPYVVLKRPNGHVYRVDMTGSKVMGVCQRLDYCLENLSKDLERHKNKLRELIVQQKETEKELNGGNPYDEEVESLIQKLKRIDEKLMEDTAA